MPPDERSNLGQIFMLPGPDTYIRAALVSEGLEVHSLVIEDYTPEHFGNLTASADTNCGRLRIVYDRDFFVDAVSAWTGPSVDALAAAMERERRHFLA
jgi:hypothetical protein